MAANLQELLDLAATETPNLPTELIKAIAMQESSGGANINHAGGKAKGILGVTPIAYEDVNGTREGFGDPNNTAIAGLKYLQKQLDATNGDFGAAAARYFGGPRAMANLDAVDPTSGKSRRSYMEDINNRVAGNQVRAQQGDVRKIDNALEPASTTASTASNTASNTAMMMQSLGTALTAITNSGDAASQAATQLQENSKALMQGIYELGQVTANSILGTSALKMKQEATAKQIAGNFGIDVEASNELVSSLAARTVQADQEHKVKLDRYNALNEVSFWDNPINWLAAQVQLPQAGAEVNSQVRNFNEAQATLTSLNASVRDTIANNNSASATVTAQTAQYAAQAETLKAANLMLQTGNISAAQHQEMIAKVAAARVQDFSLNLQIDNALDRDINRAFQRAQTEMLNEARKQGLDAKQAKEFAAKRTAENISKVLGATFTPDQIQNAGKYKAALEILGSTGRLGGDIGESLELQELIANNPKNGATIRLLRKAATEQPSSAVMAQGGINGQKAQREFAVRSIENKFANYRENTSLGEDNPYAGANPKSMLTNNPGLVSQIPLLMPVLKTFSNSEAPVPAGIIVDTLMKTLTTNLDGSLRPNVTTNEVQSLGKQISIYYTAVIQNNNSTYQFGLVNLPVQTNYKTSVPRLLGGRTGMADLTDSTQVTNLLWQKYVYEVTSKEPARMFNSPPNPQIRRSESMSERLIKDEYGSVKGQQ